MSKKANKNVPVLRFPEFEGNWQTKTLEELADWSSGGTPSKDNPDYWGGDIPWISASSMYDDIFLDSDQKITKFGLENGSKLATKGSILILVRGMILYKRIPVGITGRDLAFNQDIKCLKIRNKRELLFLFYWLKANENLIKSLVSGTNVGTGKLDTSQLKILVIFKPFIAEQEKIASFLGAIDTRLTQLRRKHELLQTYKRGVMQKLFSPQIRFKGDRGKPFPDWQKKKLGEIASRQVKKNLDESITRVLTNSAVQGVIDQQDYFDKDIANADNLAGYYIIEKGDYVYNPRISTSAPVGPIHKNKIGLGVMSPLYTVFRFKNKENAFYEQLFKTSAWHKYMCSVANYGARYDRMNITTSDFMALPLPYPISEEQEKIVDFFIAIDQKIEAVAQQIDLTEQFKKGLLQKMFV